MTERERESESEREIERGGWRGDRQRQRFNIFAYKQAPPPPPPNFMTVCRHLRIMQLSTYTRSRDSKGASTYSCIYNWQSALSASIRGSPPLFVVVVSKALYLRQCKIASDGTVFGQYQVFSFCTLFVQAAWSYGTRLMW